MLVVLIAVISIDGCLTRHTVPGAANWASPDDQAHFRSALAECDVSIMGSATYAESRGYIMANLTLNRRRIVMTRTPSRFEADAVAGRLEFTDETPSKLIERLANEQHSRCALLGGGQIYSACLAADVVDEMLITIEPRVFGTGTRLAGVTAPIDPSFSLANVSLLGTATVLLKYERNTLSPAGDQQP